jgi:RNA polymerase sigma factor (TIGR02999 family)
MNEEKGHVTQLLHAATDGDVAAVDELWSRVYDEIRSMAIGRLRNEKQDAILQPTGIISELWERINNKDGSLPKFDNRLHFFGSVARSMNQILIDHARHRGRLKRGGDRQQIPFEVSVGELVSTQGLDKDELVMISGAFKRLQEAFPQQAVVASMRWHRGLTIEQTADVLGETTQTVTKDWKFAQAWLRSELGRK